MRKSNICTIFFIFIFGVIYFIYNENDNNYLYSTTCKVNY